MLKLKLKGYIQLHLECLFLKIHYRGVQMQNLKKKGCHRPNILRSYDMHLTVCPISLSCELCVWSIKTSGSLAVKCAPVFTSYSLMVSVWCLLIVCSGFMRALSLRAAGCCDHKQH